MARGLLRRASRRVVLVTYSARVRRARGGRHRLRQRSYTCDHKDPSCGPEHGGEQLAQRYCRASRTEVPPSPPPPPPNPPIYRDPTSSWLQPHGSMGDPYVAWNAYGQPLSVRARPVLRQYLF